MKFLILNHDYGEFVAWLYRQHPGLEREPYAVQMRARTGSLFGNADFYSRNLRALGQEAHDLFFNDEPLQRAWAREQGMPLGPESRAWRFRLRRGVLPWVSRERTDRWLADILAAQIRHHRPDVLVNASMDPLGDEFLTAMKAHTRLLVGFAEAPNLMHGRDWRVYDVVFAPSEGMAAHFAAQGIPTELVRFGFGESVLEAVQPSPDRTMPVSFVGSLGGIHGRRQQLLEELAASLGDRLSVWGPSTAQLPRRSGILARYQGPAWGADVYRTLGNSRITLNCHLDAAGDADNMRLYEATGMGALLITDFKDNLQNVFEVGREVVAYRTPEECREQVEYYLAHDDERRAIAEAGQRRTLREHTYRHRMQQFLDLLPPYL